MPVTRLTERLSLLVWKMRHHDELIAGLEADLDDARARIYALKKENDLLRSMLADHRQKEMRHPDGRQ